jgi:hypothetical protein
MEDGVEGWTLEGECGIGALLELRQADILIAGQPVKRTFRLVETLPTPKVIKPEDVPASKPVRLQPEGLRMRYKPFGATGGDLEYKAADPDAMDVDEPVPRPDEDRKKKRHKSSEDKEKKEKDKKKKKRKSTGGDE